MKAYKRFPVPVEVNRVLAKVNEYDQARVYDFFATLWSVIDGQAEQLEKPTSALPSVLEDHERRLLVIEEALVPRTVPGYRRIT